MPSTWANQKGPPTTVDLNICPPLAKKMASANLPLCNMLPITTTTFAYLTFQFSHVNRTIIKEASKKQYTFAASLPPSTEKKRGTHCLTSTIQ